MQMMQLVTAENSFRQKRGDDVVWHIDHIRRPKIDGDTAYDVSLLAAEPTLLQ